MPYPEDSAATVAEFYLFGLPEHVLDDRDYSEEIKKHLCAATAQFLGMLVGRGYTLPRQGWGLDAKRNVCKSIAWDILCLRGVDPNQIGNENILKESERALAWMQSVANGEVNMMGLSQGGATVAAEREPTQAIVVVSKGSSKPRFPEDW